MTTHVTAAASVEGVTHRFAGGIVALDNVTVSIEPGTITGFIGRNGSGKTTLLRLLAGLLPTQSGAVHVLGESLHPPSPGLRARISYVSQATELDPEMTMAETFSLFAALYDVRDRGRVRALADEFGLAELLPRLVAALSGGQRQRLHLALGFLPESELLLLDEPTAALDPDGRRLIWELLERRRMQGTAIAVITHDMLEAAAHCETVVLMQQGRILAAGSPAELIASHPPDLFAVYFKLTGTELDPAERPARARNGQRGRFTED